MDWLRRVQEHPVSKIGCGLFLLFVGAYVGTLFNEWYEKTRELTYTVSPVRTTIVKAGEVSDLIVYYKGELVETDVSAVQVQLWNQGREHIRQSHMHEPLVISTADGTPILDAKILQQTRPNKPKIVDLTRDDSQKDRGRIEMSWNILEEGDGGIIQLILAGKPDVPVKAEAVIEGQRKVREVDFRSHRGIWRLIYLIGMPVILLIIAGLTVGGAIIIRKERREDKVGYVLLLSIMVGSFAMAGLFLLTIFAEFSSPPPPLDF